MTDAAHIICICRLEEIPDPGSRAFSVGEGDWPLRGFVVRQGSAVYGYVNTCPHAGHALNWHPHEFLTRDRSLIQCASHGALFDMQSGACVAGPCSGRGLRTLPIEVNAGWVILTQID